MAKAKQNKQTKVKPSVPIEQPGGLRNEMTMTVQTRHAQKLITGRRVQNGVNAIIGLMEFGKRVKQVWLSAEADDPFADWYLIKIEDELQAVKQQLAAKSRWLSDLMSGMEGFNINIAMSLQPAEIALSFQNPYGYKGAYLIHDFDVLAQLILTAKHVGLLDRETADDLIHEGGSSIRRVFRMPAEWKFTGATRADIALDNEHAQRAIGLFGVCPDEIIAGEKRAKLSPVVRKATAGLAANDQNHSQESVEHAPLLSATG